MVFSRKLFRYRYWLLIGVLLVTCMQVSWVRLSRTVLQLAEQEDGPDHENLIEDIKSTSRYQEQNDSHCTEVRHLVYLKVPKTGSGTMMSILINFGKARNLTFALSKNGGHFGEHPILNTDILPIAEGKHYDMLVHHSTYNRDTIREVFPKDTKIIASIREPFGHFISAFYYYEKDKVLLPKDILDSNNVTHQMTWIINRKYQGLSKSDTAIRPEFHRLSLRFGIPRKHMLDASWVHSYIDSVLDRDLDFVMLQEYFDESLVLVKRYFCWKLSDIIYMPKHTNKAVRTDNVYTADILWKYEQLNVAGYVLYDHYYKKFWQAVLKEGPSFFDEVRVFKMILLRIKSFCNREPGKLELIRLPASEFNLPFTVTGKACGHFTIVGSEFAISQKAKQWNEIRNAINTRDKRLR